MEDVNELNNKLEKARQIYLDNQSEIAELKNKIVTIEEMNKTLQETIDQLNYTCDNYEKQIFELELQLNNIQETYNNNTTISNDIGDSTVFVENVVDYTEAPKSNGWSSTHGTYPSDSVFQI